MLISFSIIAAENREVSLVVISHVNGLGSLINRGHNRETAHPLPLNLHVMFPFPSEAKNSTRCMRNDGYLTSHTDNCDLGHED